MNQLLKFAITSIYDSSSTSESLVPTTNTSNNIFSSSSFVLGIVIFLGITFVFICIIFWIRWWMTQTAIFKMQKDIYDIKNKIDTKEK